MGGRSEVLKMPAAESMIMVELMLREEEEKYLMEEALFWKEHLSRIFAAPPQPGESREFANAREMFLRMIDPNGYQEKVYEWEGIPQEEIDKAMALQQQQPLLNE